MLGLLSWCRPECRGLPWGRKRVHRKAEDRGQAWGCLREIPLNANNRSLLHTSLRKRGHLWEGYWPSSWTVKTRGTNPASWEPRTHTNSVSVCLSFPPFNLFNHYLYICLTSNKVPVLGTNGELKKNNNEDLTLPIEPVCLSVLPWSVCASVCFDLLSGDIRLSSGEHLARCGHLTAA